MKSLRVLSVIFLLFAFPIVSYLYLKSGYNFRFKALQELQPKTAITDFQYLSVPDSNSINIDALKGKVTILFDYNEKGQESMLQPLFDEFSHREDFQLIGLISDSSTIIGISDEEGHKQWIWAFGNYPYEKSISLIDTSLTIRNYYDFDSVSFLKMGQHIPIILPRKVDPDIKMKDQKEL